MKRRLILSLWTAFVLAGLYAAFVEQDLPVRLAREMAATPPGWAYALYLGLGCVRAFTLIPATYLVFVGMIVLPPLPLYILTLIGIVVSSAAVYRFAGAMRLDEFFERRYGPQVARLRALLQRRELPIVIAWSFFPVAPTDLVCYVCGALKVDLRKCLLGVTVGEGTICAIYIFVGGRALSWLR